MYYTTLLAATTFLLTAANRPDGGKIGDRPDTFKVKELKTEFYQDPTNPRLKKVVATAGFTHPVDSASFEPRVRAFIKQAGDKEGARERRRRGLDVAWRVWEQGETEVLTVLIRSSLANAVVLLGEDPGHGTQGTVSAGGSAIALDPELALALSPHLLRNLRDPRQTGASTGQNTSRSQRLEHAPLP